MIYRAFVKFTRRFVSTVLASSGIDYDIKLWTPSATEPMEPKDKDEVCARFYTEG